MRTIIATGILSILYCACSSPSTEKGTDKINDSTSIVKGKSIRPVTDYFKPVGDSAEIPSFDIIVQLDDKAEKKIASKNESVIVAAYFSGIPKDSTKYEDDGSYPVAGQRIELTKSRKAHFSGIKISRAMYASLADKDIEVLINIFSGRRSSEYNLLDCEILQKPISEVRGQEFVLKGKLISD